MAHNLTTDTLLELIQKTLDINKANNIVTIPLAGKADFADYMVIASGTSGRHASSLARLVEDELRKRDFKESIISGRASGDWLLLDTGDVIVHVFREEVRAFYDIEKLWLEPDNLQENIKTVAEE